jgi:hypothetical protein
MDKIFKNILIKKGEKIGPTPLEMNVAVKHVIDKKKI